MITSLSWLKNHLSTKANLNQVAERLTEIGLEVENIKSGHSIFMDQGETIISTREGKFLLLDTFRDNSGIANTLMDAN